MHPSRIVVLKPGCNPFGGVERPFHRGLLRLLENTSIFPLNSKITVGSNNENNFIVGDHHNVRSCIKGSVTALGQLRTRVLESNSSRGSEIDTCIDIFVQQE